MRRRQKVVWDTLAVAQANLPLLTLDSTNVGQDGAFTSVQRWAGSDVTLLRTIFQALIRIDELGFQVDKTAVLEICVGLSPFDSMGDLIGQAFNTTLALGTGPLSDADNSRWFARCCVLIPIGIGNVGATTQHQMASFSPTSRNPSSSQVYWVHNADPTKASITWFCEWDSRTKRKLQGSETEWIQLAMEAKVSVVPAVGDDITVALDAFSGRIVKTSAGLPAT